MVTAALVFVRVRDRELRPIVGVYQRRLDELSRAVRSFETDHPRVGPSLADVERYADDHSAEPDGPISHWTRQFSVRCAADRIVLHGAGVDGTLGTADDLTRVLSRRREGARDHGR